MGPRPARRTPLAGVTALLLSCFLLGALGLASCVMVPPALPRPAVIDVSGEWEGGWWNPYGGGPLRMTLRQENGRVSGVMEMAGSRTYAGAVVGAVDGEQITLRGEDAAPLAIELRATRDDQLDGAVAEQDPARITVSRKWPLWWRPLLPSN